MTEIRKDIKHREMMELMNAAAVFSDRFYITPKRMSVAISFCEDIPNAEENKVRARVAMSLDTFVHFADTLTAIAKQIRDAQDKQASEVQNMSDANASKAIN